MNNSGIEFLGQSPEQGDVITWHDTGELRVWIHSRQLGTSRVELSIELQVLARNSLKPSQEERGLRLKLASMSMPNDEIEGSGIKSLTLRTLPTGKLLEEHGALVSKALISETYGKRRNTTLYEIRPRRDVVLLQEAQPRRKVEIVREVSKTKDAIMIAKIYAIQQTSGTKKLAKRTAELLDVEVEVVHLSLQIARRNGWLTSKGSGMSGGDLTSEGEKEFQAAGGEVRLAKLLRKKGLK